MLLTRYAPLRRSPAMYCYIPLPLDLHVLSLPLAFILSQDQTLHCIYTFKLLAPALLFQLFINKGIYALIINVNIYYTACLFNIFNELFSFQLQALTALPFWDRKDTDFFVISKFFRNFFEKIFRFKISKNLSPSPLSFAGCKGRHYFIFCKLFWPLF